MSAAAQKIPGPDHPIAIQPSLDRVQVKFAGQTIADSTRALTLREASYRLCNTSPNPMCGWTS